MTDTQHPDRNDDPLNPFGGYRLDGTYWCGPLGVRCVLAILIASALLPGKGIEPEAERRALVRKRADHMRSLYSQEELRDLESERRQPRLARVGAFYAPRKPANSGRKKKAA